MKPQFSPFDYLLNAFEQASQSDNPADNGYGEKRKALLEYVEKLETPSPEGAQIMAKMIADLTDANVMIEVLSERLKAAPKDAERFAWLIEQDAPTQDTVLRPPIPPELLESPEKWCEVIRAAIDGRRLPQVQR